MTRQRTMEEAAQRREAQRNERETRRTGRLAVREAVSNMQHLVPRFTAHPAASAGSATGLARRGTSS